MTIEFVTDYGNVEVRNIMMDLDGINLDEGISIKFIEGNNKDMEILGVFDLDDMDSTDIELVIQENFPI